MVKGLEILDEDDEKRDDKWKNFFKLICLIIYRIRSIILFFLIPIALWLMIIIYTERDEKPFTRYIYFLILTYWALTEIHPIIIGFLPYVLFSVLTLVESSKIARMYFKIEVAYVFGLIIFAIAFERVNLHRKIALYILLNITSNIVWIVFLMGFSSLIFGIVLSRIMSLFIHFLIIDAIVVYMDIYRMTKIKERIATFSIGDSWDEVTKNRLIKFKACAKLTVGYCTYLLYMIGVNQYNIFFNRIYNWLNDSAAFWFLLVLYIPSLIINFLVILIVLMIYFFGAKRSIRYISKRRKNKVRHFNQEMDRERRISDATSIAGAFLYNSSNNIPKSSNVNNVNNANNVNKDKNFNNLDNVNSVNNVNNINNVNNDWNSALQTRDSDLSNLNTSEQPQNLEFPIRIAEFPAHHLEMSTQTESFMPIDHNESTREIEFGMTNLKINETINQNREAISNLESYTNQIYRNNPFVERRMPRVTQNRLPVNNYRGKTSATNFKGIPKTNKNKMLYKSKAAKDNVIDYCFLSFDYKDSNEFPFNQVTNCRHGLPDTKTRAKKIESESAEIQKNDTETGSKNHAMKKEIDADEKKSFSSAHNFKSVEFEDSAKESQEKEGGRVDFAAKQTHNSSSYPKLRRRKNLNISSATDRTQMEDKLQTLKAGIMESNSRIKKTANKSISTDSESELYLPLKNTRQNRRLRKMKKSDQTLDEEINYSIAKEFKNTLPYVKYDLEQLETDEEEDKEAWKKITPRNQETGTDDTSLSSQIDKISGDVKQMSDAKDVCCEEEDYKSDAKDICLDEEDKSGDDKSACDVNKEELNANVKDDLSSEQTEVCRDWCGQVSRTEKTEQMSSTHNKTVSSDSHSSDNSYGESFISECNSKEKRRQILKYDSYSSSSENDKKDEVSSGSDESCGNEGASTSCDDSESPVAVNNRDKIISRRIEKFGFNKKLNFRNLAKNNYANKDNLEKKNPAKMSYITSSRSEKVNRSNKYYANSPDDNTSTNYENSSEESNFTHEKFHITRSNIRNRNKLNYTCPNMPRPKSNFNSSGRDGNRKSFWNKKRITVVSESESDEDEEVAFRGNKAGMKVRSLYKNNANNNGKLEDDNISTQKNIQITTSKSNVDDKNLTVKRRSSIIKATQFQVEEEMDNSSMSSYYMEEDLLSLDYQQDISSFDDDDSAFPKMSKLIENKIRLPMYTTMLRDFKYVLHAEMDKYRDYNYGCVTLCILYSLRFILEYIYHWESNYFSGWKIYVTEELSRYYINFKIEQVLTMKSLACLMLLVFSCFLLPSKHHGKAKNSKTSISFMDSPTILEWNFVKRRISWSIIFFQGATLAISDLCYEGGCLEDVWRSIESRLIDFDYYLATFLLSLIAMLFGWLSNNGCLVGLLKIGAKIAQKANLDPLHGIFPVFVSLSSSFCIPTSHTIHYMTYATGDVQKKDFFICGMLISLAVFCVNLSFYFLFMISAYDSLGFPHVHVNDSNLMSSQMLYL